jgi:hypothetical protein
VFGLGELIAVVDAGEPDCAASRLADSKPRVFLRLCLCDNPAQFSIFTSAG